MHYLKHHSNLLFLLLSFFFFLPSFYVGIGGATKKLADSSANISPFTPKAYLIRYWKKHVTSGSEIPSFLLDKASPLTATQSATFTKLADQNTLSTHLSSFCSSAKLLCFPDLSRGVIMPNIRMKYNARRNYNLDHPPPSGGVNKWVEQGSFFREKILKSGNVIPMPDIRDKMPKRSFLPRVLSSKLPFTSSRLNELKAIFHADDNSSMASMSANTLNECESAPSRNEIKQCVNSVEDMVDFASSVLGQNVIVRITENTKGSKEDVLVGKVKEINGGKIIKAVSCHQSLFPYLVYYCHSLPKVRVYEADLLDPKSKTKINHGIAVCHVDTSDWSASHVAFVLLGPGPGKIEVCHWVYENDMNWTVSE